jgi:selenobiotic family peptide radical SAM maturase
MLRDGRLFGRTFRGFTLQWHLTNACPEACRHCYDRSTPSPLSLTQALDVLRQLQSFCARHDVGGGVCFTGGDPFLYPHFFDVYRAAVDRGFDVSILGNPVPADALAALCAIRTPRSYQVSLEGREACNDAIRGAGHYARVLPFLDRLHAHGVRTHVMLTLHRDNLGEAEGLAVALKGKADRFLYNRLAQVGGGADLQQPTREEYAAFMRSWHRLAREFPFLGFKDNLFNIPRYHFGWRVWGGCTGAGCGAAFNFVALLPDGEVHACRKLPSPLGNVLDQGLEAIYASAEAQRYRTGCRECYMCPIRNYCGGCLAVGYGMGRDVFEQVDPHCFFAEREAFLSVRAAVGAAEPPP